MPVLEPNEKEAKCLLCDYKVIRKQCLDSINSGFYYHVNCPICGAYNFDGHINACFENKGEEIKKRDIIRGIAKNMFFRNDILFFDYPTYLLIQEGKFDSVHIIGTFEEKCDALLLYIKKTVKIPYVVLTLEDSLYPLFFCENEAELISLVISNEAYGYIEKAYNQDKRNYRLTNEGWKYLREHERGIDSQICFVAMKFDDPVIDKMYDEAIHHAIRDSEYLPKRIDIHNAEYPDSKTNIDDSIIALIRKSKFMIADFTGARPNVYYEAGYAKGLGLPVIMCCREDRCKEDMHFDTRNKIHIIWTSDKLPQFRERLRNRIEAEIGKGTYTGE